MLAGNREKILTEPMHPLLLKTAIPTMIGMLVNVLYNLTDTFFIGRLNDKSMTAAIGVVFSFVSVAQAFGFWFGYGSGNTMSRNLGEKKNAEAQTIASTGIVMALFASLILTIPLCFHVRELAGFLGGNASSALLEYTTEYLKIILISVPFQMYALTVYNQLRLCGNVKAGMIGLLVAIFP